MEVHLGRRVEVVVVPHVAAVGCEPGLAAVAAHRLEPALLLGPARVERPGPVVLCPAEDLTGRVLGVRGQRLELDRPQPVVDRGDVVGHPRQQHLAQRQVVGLQRLGVLRIAVVVPRPAGARLRLVLRARHVDPHHTAVLADERRIAVVGEGRGAQVGVDPHLHVPIVGRVGEDRGHVVPRRRARIAARVRGPDHRAPVGARRHAEPVAVVDLELVVVHRAQVPHGSRPRARRMRDQAVVAALAVLAIVVDPEPRIGRVRARQLNPPVAGVEVVAHRVAGGQMAVGIADDRARVVDAPCPRRRGRVVAVDRPVVGGVAEEDPRRGAHVDEVELGLVPARVADELVRVREVVLVHRVEDLPPGRVGARLVGPPEPVAEHRRVELVGMVRVDQQLRDPAGEEVEPRVGRGRIREGLVGEVLLEIEGLPAVGRPVHAQRRGVGGRAPAPVHRRRAVPRQRRADVDVVRVVGIHSDPADRAVGRHRGAPRHERPRVAEVGRLEEAQPGLRVARPVRLTRARVQGVVRGVEIDRAERRRRHVARRGVPVDVVGERVVGGPHSAARRGNRHPAVARRAGRVDRDLHHAARLLGRRAGQRLGVEELRRLAGHVGMERPQLLPGRRGLRLRRTAARL